MNSLFPVSFNRLASSTLALVAAIALLAPGAAYATPIVSSVDGPLTEAQFLSLNGTGAKYKPPSNATFPDGPYTVASGKSVFLTGGPSAANANSVVLVLSASDLGGLGSGTIGLTFVDSGNHSYTVTFDSSDFFSTSAAGFPSKIKGIANGAVNGIKFPDAQHAGADFIFDSALIKNDVLGSVSITSPIDLRVDVFGDYNGLIVGNAANSGAEGIASGPPISVPEPAALGMFGLGLLLFGGFVTMRRRGQRQIG